MALGLRCYIHLYMASGILSFCIIPIQIWGTTTAHLDGWGFDEFWMEQHFDVFRNLMFGVTFFVVRRLPPICSHHCSASYFYSPVDNTVSTGTGSNQ